MQNNFGSKDKQPDAPGLLSRNISRRASSVATDIRYSSKQRHSARKPTKKQTLTNVSSAVGHYVTLPRIRHAKIIRAKSSSEPSFITRPPSTILPTFR